MILYLNDNEVPHLKTAIEYVLKVALLPHTDDERKLLEKIITRVETCEALQKPQKKK